jgi:hypothetical protein
MEGKGDETDMGEMFGAMCRAGVDDESVDDEK